VKSKKKLPRKKTTAKKPAKVKTQIATAKPKIDADRAEAAAEVLQAVFLHEKHFDLESAVVLKDGRPVVDEDAEGHLWVTVKLHVPALDVDSWLDGTHLDHPDNQVDHDGVDP
jgi:uncharacterized protein YhdP